MENKLMIPDISAFDMTQGQIETFADMVQEEIKEGNLDPIKAYGISKAMEKLTKAIQSKVKDNAEMAVRSLLPAGKKSIDIGNFTFTFTERKVYQIENSPKIEEMVEEISHLSNKIKEFNDLAKATGIPIPHPVFGTIKPAVLKNMLPGISVNIMK